MHLKKILALGFTALLCSGIICACGGSEHIDSEQTSAEQAGEEQTGAGQTGEEQTGTGLSKNEQTEAENMKETGNENNNTDNEVSPIVPDMEGMANGFAEKTDTAPEGSSTGESSAKGTSDGESSSEGTSAGESAEELPTDENGIVVDCPKSVYEKRAGMEYGTVTHVTYYSETTGCERGANILLPAGYSEEKKYPVVYFQHGIFGDEYGLINDSNNKIREIFGNLAADGLTRECIVVFTNMYVTGDPSLKPGFNSVQIAPYDNFIYDLINDLMPYIEENYSVLTGRENTGLLGFSMGGRESLYVGLVRPDLFAHTCGISPAPGLTPGRDWAMAHEGQLSEDELVFPDDKPAPELYMVCCGTSDSVVGKFPASYHDILTRNGTEHIWYEIPGADHDNRAIRSGIYNFLIRWNTDQQ